MPSQPKKDYRKSMENVNRVHGRSSAIMSMLTPELHEGMHPLGQPLQGGFVPLPMPPLPDPVTGQMVTREQPVQPLTLFLGGVAIANYAPEERAEAQAVYNALRLAMDPLVEELGAKTAAKVNALLTTEAITLPA